MWLLPSDWSLTERYTHQSLVEVCFQGGSFPSISHQPQGWQSRHLQQGRLQWQEKTLRQSTPGASTGSWASEH